MIGKGAYSLKKTVFLLFLLVFCIDTTAHGQKKTDVLLKYSTQNGLQRVVLETDEDFVNRAKITTSASQIIIEFPDQILFTSEKVIPFQLVPGEKSLVINLTEKSETKFFRLVSPPRLVFDIRKKEIPSAKTPVPSEKPADKQQEKQALILSGVFVIDPGHGGYDFGIRYGSASEKEINLNLARELGDVLAKKGKKVFYIRRVDQYASLAERINMINQKKPDIFLSLHASSLKKFVIYSPRYDDQGTGDVSEIYSLASKQRKYLGKSKTLAESIEKALKDVYKEEVIRRKMPLPLLHSAGAPAVLIEYPSPQFLSYDQQARTQLINAILAGIASYDSKYVIPAPVKEKEKEKENLAP
jgi:N-acetylmuramoyl-L-alanine amidase